MYWGLTKKYCNRVFIRYTLDYTVLHINFTRSVKIIPKSLFRSAVSFKMFSKIVSDIKYWGMRREFIKFFRELLQCSGIIYSVIFHRGFSCLLLSPLIVSTINCALCFQTNIELRGARIVLARDAVGIK